MNISPKTGILVISAMLLAWGIISYYTYNNLQLLWHSKEMILDWCQAHILLALSTYLIIFIVTTIIALPTTTLMTVLGGYLFGVLTGSCCAIFASTIGSIICFLLVEKGFMHLGTSLPPKHAHLITTLQKKGVGYIFIARLIPVIPFAAITIAAALVRLSFWRFVVYTLVGGAPQIIFYAYTGSWAHIIKSPLITAGF